jgi:hypothetical protein
VVPLPGLLPRGAGHSGADGAVAVGRRVGTGPGTALRLAANLHGVHGSGKSDREGFYAAALWLHERHPRTLARNAEAFAALGYLKDLPELLH